MMSPTPGSGSATNRTKLELKPVNVGGESVKCHATKRTKLELKH